LNTCTKVEANAPSSTKTMVNPRTNSSIGASGLRSAAACSPTICSPVMNEM
jgi:hypothetical protein